MRKCPICDEYTASDSETCSNCLSVDHGWAECIAPMPNSNRASKIATVPSKDNCKPHSSVPPFVQLSLFDSTTIEQPLRYSIRLSGHTDEQELGFELENLVRLRKKHPFKLILVELRATALAYLWDYKADSEPDRDVYLPPNLPLPALVEIARFAHVLKHQLHNIEVLLTLPPQNHAASKFIMQTGLFTEVCTISHCQDKHEPTSMQGSDDVLIPLVAVGPETKGQLSDMFYDRFDLLADAGRIDSKYRSPLRKVIMEATENATTWGGRGYACAFLRQESRGRKGFHYSTEYKPERDTHLFIHVFSTQGSLGTSLGLTEQAAAKAIERGKTARTNGLGRGLPFIINTVSSKALGTVFMYSGGFTRIISPDGLRRDFYSAGLDHLPGVHLGAVIPLAVISRVTTEAYSLALAQNELGR